MRARGLRFFTLLFDAFRFLECFNERIQSNPTLAILPDGYFAHQSALKILKRDRRPTG